MYTNTQGIQQIREGGYFDAIEHVYQHSNILNLPNWHRSIYISPQIVNVSWKVLYYKSISPCPKWHWSFLEVYFQLTNSINLPLRYICFFSKLIGKYSEIVLCNKTYLFCQPAQALLLRRHKLIVKDNSDMNARVLVNHAKKVTVLLWWYVYRYKSSSG